MLGPRVTRRWVLGRPENTTVALYQRVKLLSIIIIIIIIFGRFSTESTKGVIRMIVIVDSEGLKFSCNKHSNVFTVLL